MAGNLEQERKEWIFSEYYGLPDAPEAADCICYGKSLMVCANGDGELTDAERDWIVGFSLAHAVPHEDAETLRTYDGSDTIEDLINERPIMPAVRRALVYDAIRACDSDEDYSDSERRTVKRMSQEMGLTEDDYQQVEQVWRAEKDAKNMRVNILFQGATAAS